jgi:hypothetical protein
MAVAAPLVGGSHQSYEQVDRHPTKNLAMV